MNNYEEKVNENIERNKKYLKEFEKWLEEKELAKKTIKKHIVNVELYLNEYLNYYDISKMEDGIYSVYSYLSGWFIEKCLWATKNSLKENASSIKRFYQCMCEKEYVKKEDYKDLCDEIKIGMDEIIEMIDEFDNGTYYDIF